MKHFTVLEVGADSESPMVCTIGRVKDTPDGLALFKERLTIALKEHFDVEDVNYGELPDLFVGSPYEEIEVQVGTYKYTIRILETWMY